MRCPSCGQDADPANALCPHCHAALHIPAAPSGPYAPQYAPPPPQHGPPPPPQYGPPQQPPDYGWSSGNYQILEPGAPPERSRSPWLWVVVVIAILLVGGGAAIAAVKLTKHPGGTPTGAPSTRRPATTAGTTGAPTTASADGKAQATAIDTLLNASSASRQ